MKIPVIHYKRSRFTARLPETYRYSPSHFWLREEESGVWQVGFTKFATRMLGDIVEFEFKVTQGGSIAAGDVIGWTEGFKALSDIYSAANGEFLGANPALQESITLLDNDPFGAGWLYRVRGTPGAGTTDVHGYIAILDATIDKMLNSRHAEPPDEDNEEDKCLKQV